MKLRLFKSRRQALAAIVLLSAALRIAFLSHPREVVFDEYGYGKQINMLCCTYRQRFDIHPPHGKLPMALIAKLVGYDGKFDFPKIGTPYEDVPIFWLRLFPALCGVGLSAIVFLLILQLGGSTVAAFLGGFLVAFDNALIAQNRLLSVDSVLLLGTFGALSAYLAAKKAKGAKALSLFALCGALASLAVGSKFTGLAVFALIFLLHSAQFLCASSKNFGRFALELGIFVVTAGLLYLAGWYYYLGLYPGQADQFYEFHGGFWKDFVGLHNEMLWVNSHTSRQHKESSPWWMWPILARPMWWWGHYGESSHPNIQSIYTLGNPMAWWGSTVTLFLLSLHFLKERTKAWRSPFWIALSIPLLGYGISFFPLVFVSRPLFSYHYLTPLVFSIIAGCLWIDRTGAIGNGEKPNANFAACLILIVCFFALISPFTYGFSWPEGYTAILNRALWWWRGQFGYSS